MMEPWDGPASIVFSDGELMGAVLDRNGLRPSRYCITSDGFLILSSETGCIDVPPEMIVKKDRLRPGKMLLADTLFLQLVLMHHYNCPIIRMLFEPFHIENKFVLV
jgi:glutamate synthase (ferredoxin)